MPNSPRLGVLLLLGSTIPLYSATLTIGDYTGVVPTLDQGSMMNFQGASDSGGAGSELTVGSSVPGGPWTGANPTGLGGNYTNTGFGATITLAAGAGETIEDMALGFTLGTFDDGLRIDFNGTTVLDFDFSNYSNNSDFSAIFGGSWTPWSNEGAPALILDESGLRLMATATSNGTGTTAGVIAGNRVNILEYFTATTYVADPGSPDFTAGTSIAVFNRNDTGPWGISTPQIVASATVVPEPASFALAAAGMVMLLRRRR